MRLPTEIGDNLRVVFPDVNRAGKSPTRLACIRAWKAAQKAGYRSSPSEVAALVLGTLTPAEIKQRALEALQARAQQVAK